MQTKHTRQTAPILVVEDDLLLRDTIEWVLEEEGLPVETAADGRQALEAAEQYRPALVVLDMMLPHLDGSKVADGLHSLFGHTVPILLITADGRAAEKARRTNAYAFLQKPFDIADLLAAVDRGLQTGR